MSPLQRRSRRPEQLANGYLEGKKMSAKAELLETLRKASERLDKVGCNRSVWRDTSAAERAFQAAYLACVDAGIGHDEIMKCFE